MESGVFPTMTLASFPTASTLFSGTETATTDGSFKTTPSLGTNTKVLAVPRSIPNFFMNKGINLSVLCWLLIFASVPRFFHIPCLFGKHFLFWIPLWRLGRLLQKRGLRANQGFLFPARGAP